MSETYPHPCTHCGFCCLATPCTVAIHLMGAKQGLPCPALEWQENDPDRSRCGILANPERHLSKPALHFIRTQIPDLAEAMGSGAGCCMKARVVGGGNVIDFASLSEADKITVTRQTFPVEHRPNT